MGHFYRHWMETTTEIHDKPLSQICLPASHDSGTCALKNQWVGTAPQDIVVEIKEALSVPLVSNAIGTVGTWVTNLIYKVVNHLSTTTTKTIAQQLDDGIRCIDIRLYSDGKATPKFYTQHSSDNLGLVGTPMEQVLSDVKNFVQSASGEIIYITFGHCVNFVQNTTTKQDDYKTFHDLVSQYLSLSAIGPSAVSSLFDATYTQLLATDTEPTPTSRIILVAGEPKLLQQNETLFWGRDYSPPDGPSGVISGSYTNTDDLTTMLKDQYGKFSTFVTARNQTTAPPKAFALYMTLTPQVKTLISPITKNEVALALGAAAAGFWWLPPVAAALGIVAGAMVVSNITIPYTTLKQVADKVNRGLLGALMPTQAHTTTYGFAGIEDPSGTTPNTSPPPGLNLVTFLYGDYYESSTLVSTAIALSKLRQPATSVKRSGETLTPTLVPIFRLKTSDGGAYAFGRSPEAYGGFEFDAIAFYGYADNPNGDLVPIHAYSYTSPTQILADPIHALTPYFCYGPTQPTLPPDSFTLTFLDMGVAWYAPKVGTANTVPVNSMWKPVVQAEESGFEPKFYYSAAAAPDGSWRSSGSSFSAFAVVPASTQ
jgi:hypothetical protein